VYFCLSAHGGQAPELFANCSKANVVTGLQRHFTGESSDHSKANVITGLQHHSAGVSFDSSKANVIAGPQHHSAGVSFDRSNANVITGLQHHSAGVSFDRSNGNVITGLQHHSDGGLPANPGPVIQNPNNNVKGESLKPLSFRLLYKPSNNIYFCILCRTLYIYIYIRKLYTTVKMLTLSL